MCLLFITLKEKTNFNKNLLTFPLSVCNNNEKKNLKTIFLDLEKVIFNDMLNCSRSYTKNNTSHRDRT